MRQFNAEIDNYERGLEDDSSDDEDESIMPSDWEGYDCSQLTVNPSVNVAWEYRENEVCEGAPYANSGELKDAVKRWSTLTLNMGFRVLKSSLVVYDVRCVKHDCPFRVHAYKGKWKDYWKISIVVDHTCTLDQLDASHRNLTAGFVANHMYSQI
jgi:mRNA-degrading endonuclease YafQ of YafQ-DinJ toxin-antitoxin module